MRGLRIMRGILALMVLSACSHSPSPAATPILIGTTQLVTETLPPEGAVGPLTPAAESSTTRVPKGRFSTFLGALEQTGLSDQLRGGRSYTLFAPANDVIEKMPEATRLSWFQDQARLSRLLEYHIVEGKWTTADLQKVSSLDTMEGMPLSIKQEDSGAISVNGAHILLPTLQVNNFLIYSIDAVLIPPD